MSDIGITHSIRSVGATKRVDLHLIRADKIYVHFLIYLFIFVLFELKNTLLVDITNFEKIVNLRNVVYLETIQKNIYGSKYCTNIMR